MECARARLSPEAMPALYEGDQLTGAVRDEVAAAWGLKSGVAVGAEQPAAAVVALLRLRVHASSRVGVAMPDKKLRDWVAKFDSADFVVALETKDPELKARMAAMLKETKIRHVAPPLIEKQPEQIP